MKTLDERQQQLITRTQAKLELSVFPSHAAPVFGALALALSLQPWNALAAWAISWLVLQFALQRKLAWHHRRTWMWLGSFVRAVNTWPVRWLLIADGIAAALRHGAPAIPSLAILAGWMALDLWQAGKRQQGNRRVRFG